MKRKSLSRKVYDGRSEVYSDVSIFMSALVMKVWKLSLEEVTRKLRLYPELTIVCGYQPGRTISKSHLSRRIRRLGSFTILLFLRISYVPDSLSVFDGYRGYVYKRLMDIRN